MDHLANSTAQLCQGGKTGMWAGRAFQCEPVTVFKSGNLSV